MTAEPTTELSFLETLKALNTDRLFVHVELDRLKIDKRYQRTINKERVRRMAANYDERLMGVLVCSVRDDGVYVIDGQHRLEIARLLGHPTIRCELRIGLSVKEEAYLFYSLDTARTSLTSDDGFRALLMAQDETALAIAKAIEDAGLRVSFGGATVGGVRSFKTLLAVTRQYGIEMVRTTLKVLHDAFPTSETPAPATIVEGMAFFLTKYPDISTKELSRALGHNSSPLDLTQKARTIAGSMAWSTKMSMAQAILGAYNYKRSSQRLEDHL